MASPRSIRACVILQDGSAPCLMELPALAAPHDKTDMPLARYSIPKEEINTEKVQQMASSFAIWKDDDARISGFLATRLPGVQPQRPDLIDEEAWNKRFVIGDTRFHMFIAPAKREGPLLRMPGTNKFFPLRCDAVILKVSSRLDSNRQRKYENLGHNSEQLSEEVKFFVNQVAEMLESAGRGG